VISRLSVWFALFVAMSIGGRAQTTSGRGELASPTAETLQKIHSLADQGDVASQKVLGAMFDAGHQPAEAVVWYRKAAEQGDALAQALLGQHYQTGNGVPQDYALAAKWARQAAEQGNPIGQFDLGFLLMNALGVTKDATEAVKWATRAAEQDCKVVGTATTLAICAQARIFVSAAYASGDGVPRDYVLAYMWANVAAATLSNQEQKRAAKMRDEIARLMTPQQIADAQKLSRDWKPGTPTK
jgi:TPR repeat protein